MIDIDLQGGPGSCPPAVFEGFLVFRQHFCLRLSANSGKLRDHCTLEPPWRFHMLTKHVILCRLALSSSCARGNGVFGVKFSSFQGVWVHQWNQSHVGRYQYQSTLRVSSTKVAHAGGFRLLSASQEHPGSRPPWVLPRGLWTSYTGFTVWLLATLYQTPFGTVTGWGQFPIAAYFFFECGPSKPIRPQRSKCEHSQLLLLGWNVFLLTLGLRLWWDATMGEKTVQESR